MEEAMKHASSSLTFASWMRWHAEAKLSVAGTRVRVSAAASGQGGEGELEAAGIGQSLPPATWPLSTRE